MGRGVGQSREGGRGVATPFGRFKIGNTMNKKPFAFQLAGAGAVRLGYIPLFKLVSGLFFYFIIINTLSESTTICQEMCNAQKKTAQFCEIQ